MKALNMVDTRYELQLNEISFEVEEGALLRKLYYDCWTRQYFSSVRIKVGSGATYLGEVMLERFERDGARVIDRAMGDAHWQDAEAEVHGH